MIEGFLDWFAEDEAPVDAILGDESYPVTVA
jgi:hypothetical protein